MILWGGSYEPPLVTGLSSELQLSSQWVGGAMGWTSDLGSRGTAALLRGDWARCWLLAGMTSLPSVSPFTLFSIHQVASRARLLSTVDCMWSRRVTSVTV